MQRIVIIRFSSIGDIVLTSPVARVLRTRFPEADIRYVTKRQYAALVESNANLTGTFLLGESLNALAKELRAFEPDLVIDLHHNLRTRILRTLVGGKWLSFQKLNVEKWLKVNLKVDRLPKVHIVDRYLETLKPLGIEGDGKGLDFFFPKEFEVPLLPLWFGVDAVQDLPVPTRSGHPSFAGGERNSDQTLDQSASSPPDKGEYRAVGAGRGFAYIALVIGAKFKTKQLPVAKLIALCNGLKHPIVLIGGKEDKAVAEELCKRSTAHIYDACGTHSLAESAWLVKQADLVITHDTGMMHIAAAFNKKIISVWGNTIPAFGMYPYLPNGEAAYLSEVKGLDCRPCSKIGFDACPKAHFKCMNEQNIDRIIIRTNETLRTSG